MAEQELCFHVKWAESIGVMVHPCWEYGPPINLANIQRAYAKLIIGARFTPKEVQERYRQHLLNPEQDHGYGVNYIIQKMEQALGRSLNMD